MDCGGCTYTMHYGAKNVLWDEAFETLQIVYIYLSDNCTLLSVEVDLCFRS